MRPESGAVGKPLAEIDLPTNTGAVIVAIVRGDSNVVVPNPDEVIREGDLIELAGSSESVAAAARLLNAPGCIAEPMVSV